MDAVAEIKGRLSVEDVVSEYVQLKRAGRNFKGLSPFTSEKSPSFVVSPEKQIWHDFSSGKGGDMFTFVQEVEGLDFKGSLELLARKAGVDLEEFKPKGGGPKGPSSGQKNRLYDAVEAAVKFYQVQLTRSTSPLKYLREKRGYEKQTIIDFRFGYSPTSGSDLLKYLLGKGFNVEELKKAGLVNTRGRDAFDMFRGRIMVPLSDSQGRPVGFTARQLSEDKNSPKYINTPSTILYDKGRQVFGLSQAKEAIRKSGFVVVVEGNLDVVASHQAGIKNVVASAGTALTTFHLKDLKRFTGDIRLAFDDDRAGQDAAVRAIPLAQSLGGIELSIVSVPEGKDPDELVRKDPKLWQSVVDAPKYMVDWLIQRSADRLDLKTAQGKRLFIEEIIAIVRQLTDEVEQEHYAHTLAEMTNTSKETILAKLRQEQAPTRRLKRVKSGQSEEKDIKDQRVREQHLLAIAMRQKTVAQLLNKIPPDVFSEQAQPTAQYVAEHPGVTPVADGSTTEAEYATLLSLLFEEYYQHTDEDELQYQATHLISRLIHTYAKTKKTALATEMGSANETDQSTLLTAVKQLDDLITQFSAK